MKVTIFESSEIGINDDLEQKLELLIKKYYKEVVLYKKIGLLNFKTFEQYLDENI